MFVEWANKNKSMFSRAHCKAMATAIDTVYISGC